MKPDGEGTGELEAIHGLLVPGAKLVGGLVAFDAQDVKHLADGGVEADLAIEPEEQVSLAGVAGEFDAAAGGDVLGKRFTKLAQLDQRGVRIGSKDLLGGNGQLQENGVMLGEEGEIAGNDQAPDSVMVACIRHGREFNALSQLAASSVAFSFAGCAGVM